MTVVKRHARTQGLTQERIARELGVSLPTVKRWFAGKGVTLDHLERLLGVVGLPLSEASAALSGPALFEYLVEQESYLAKHPDAFAFFDHLVLGETVAKVRRKFGLSPQRTHQYLAQLERLELIEWLPRDRVTLRFDGEPKWRAGGPLSQAYRSHIRESFLAGRGEERFFLHEYSSEDAELIQAKLLEVSEIAASAHRRSKATMNAKPHGLFLALKGFRWNLDETLGRKR
jgi:transcriptional regulator with XRE-family HTH domain